MDTLEEELKNKKLLLPKDPNDEKNVIVEIKGAAGGDEGKYLLVICLECILNLQKLKVWKIEILSATEGTMGGFTSIEFLVSGDHVY